ncbi:MAG: hypothetical protein JWO33_1840 [Caulobacteraceae bacterium]|nr:hypothetical protein [Caulobacteraceae bacterium]
MARLVRILWAVFVLAFAAGPALAKPPVWVIRDADSTIVLFGSVHMLPRGVDWAPKPLTDALAAADDLWFEIPLDAASQADIADQAARNALLPPGQRLSGLLDPTSRARLKRIARRLRMPVEDIDPLQPWMAEVRLSIGMLQTQGGLSNEGVEEQLAAIAPPRVQRRSFETGRQQIGILSGDDLATQLTSLKETLRELDRDPNAYRRMLRAWLAGDVRALDREAVEPIRKATPKSYKSLVLDRNRAWIEIIAGRLAGSGRTVMVVGAGHLVGPDSVPALLRARGLAVEGP